MSLDVGPLTVEGIVLGAGEVALEAAESGSGESRAEALAEAGSSAEGVHRERKCGGSYLWWFR